MVRARILDAKIAVTRIGHRISMMHHNKDCNTKNMTMLFPSE
jgi:hypothetical protein